MNQRTTGSQILALRPGYCRRNTTKVTFSWLFVWIWRSVRSPYLRTTLLDPFLL